MTISIKYVPLANVDQTWEFIEKYVESTIPFNGGDYTVDQIRLYLNTGQWLLIVAVNESNKILGAAGVSFVNFPNYRAGYVNFMAGKLICSKATYEEFCAILRSHGATRVRGAARDSAARLYAKFGLKERYKIVEAKI
jgi:hypothetical protein